MLALGRTPCRGLSGRTDALVITERSAESHVERIRGRLGFRSRAQIAAWFVASNRGRLTSQVR